MPRHNLVALLFLALALLLGQTRVAHAAESYDNCTGFITSLPAIVGTPGTWCLNQDLGSAMTSGLALTIQSNDVVIDCNGFTIDGSAAGLATRATGIGGDGLVHVKVRRCDIRGFFYGLVLGAGNPAVGGDYVVEDNRLDGNTLGGINVGGDDSLIRRNRVTNTGGTTAAPQQDGRGITSYYSVDILDNSVSGVCCHQVRGIEMISNLNGSVIGGNRIRGLTRPVPGASAMGIFISGNRVVLRNNNMVGDGNADSIGLDCVGTASAYTAKDNVISGFATGILHCMDGGRNTVIP